MVEVSPCIRLKMLLQVAMGDNASMREALRGNRSETELSVLPGARV
jgi:hypothetical protein